MFDEAGLPFRLEITFLTLVSLHFREIPVFQHMIRQVVFVLRFVVAHVASVPELVARTYVAQYVLTQVDFLVRLELAGVALVATGIRRIFMARSVKYELVDVLRFETASGTLEQVRVRGVFMPGRDVFAEIAVALALEIAQAAPQLLRVGAVVPLLPFGFKQLEHRPVSVGQHVQRELV